MCLSGGLHCKCKKYIPSLNLDVVEERPLEDYKVVLVPTHFITDPDVVARLENFIQKGRAAVVTCRSGVKDKNGNCILGQELSLIISIVF